MPLKTLTFVNFDFHSLSIQSSIACFTLPYFTSMISLIFTSVFYFILTFSDDFAFQFSDSNVLEEIIRMFLEVLNSCIVTKLLDNPNLVYALLHERETIEQLQTHSKFQDVTYNFNVVISKSFSSVSVLHIFFTTGYLSISLKCDMRDLNARQIRTSDWMESRHQS